MDPSIQVSKYNQKRWRGTISFLLCEHKPEKKEISILDYEGMEIQLTSKKKLNFETRVECVWNKTERFK